MLPVDALLHPLRSRIVDVLDGRPGTIAEIARRLGGDSGRPVATTTLYRHVGVLVDCGLIKVVEMRPTEGAPTAVYGLDYETSILDPKSVDHERMMRLVAMVQASTRRRFQAIAVDAEAPLPLGRLATFNKTLHLTDEQVRALKSLIVEFTAHHVADAPPPGTRPQFFAFFTCPEPDPADPQNGGASTADPDQESPHD